MNKLLVILSIFIICLFGSMSPKEHIIDHDFDKVKIISPIKVKIDSIDYLRKTRLDSYVSKIKENYIFLQTELNKTDSIKCN